MFGHQKHFVYGYICGRFEKHLKAIAPSDCKDIEICIPAKYFLPKNIVGKRLSPDIDTRLKACNKFKKNYHRLKDILNEHIRNLCNPAISITSVETGFYEDINLPVVAIKLEWKNI